MVVRPAISRDSASCTWRSLSVSSALVASSSSRIGRIAQHGAGDGDALALAARQFQPAFADARVIAFRQFAAMKSWAAALRAAAFDLGQRRAGLAQRDIGGHAFVEQHGFLGHHARWRRAGIPASRHWMSWPSMAIVPPSGFVETQQQIEDGALAGAGWPHQRDLLARREYRVSTRVSGRRHRRDRRS